VSSSRQPAEGLLPQHRTRTLTAASVLGRIPRDWINLLILALLVKVLLTVLTLLAYGSDPDPLTALGRSWDQWDARHYLFLAANGYRATGDARNLIAFFPLYPALVGALATAGLPLRLAALLVSNVAGVAAAVLLYEIARLDRDARAAFRAAAFFTLFPTAYFLLVGYTEALFCALSFAAVLAARHRRWIASGILGGLSAATRLTGVALLPFLAAELLIGRPSLRRAWQPLGAGVLILLGFATYLVTNQLVLGNPFAFVSVQREHWSHALAAPWVGFATAVSSIGWRIPWEKLTVGGGELAGGLTAYAVSALSWLRLRPSDAVYATVLTVMVTFLPFWLSIPRYLLAMYPLFLLVGRIESRWLYLTMVAGSLVAFVVFGLAFGRGYWAF
jgi:Gpi18-like mannosyltransferase